MNSNWRVLLLAFVCALAVSPTGGAEPAVRITTDIAFLGADRAEKLDLYLLSPSRPQPPEDPVS